MGGAARSGKAVKNSKMGSDSISSEKKKLSGTVFLTNKRLPVSRQALWAEPSASAKRRAALISTKADSSPLSFKQSLTY
jgi:hypothetical protein